MDAGKEIQKPLEGPQGKRTNWFALALAAIVLCSLLCAFYFGMRKEFSFIDEFFSYTLSNNEIGITPAFRNNSWLYSDVIVDALTVDYGEEYQFGRAYHMQLHDVHPPLYYLFIHGLSSMFMGSYSKWIGLTVNLFVLLASVCLVAAIAYFISDRNKGTTLVVTLFYAFSPATISDTMMIRMYLMLSMYVLAVLLWHVLLMKKKIPFWLFLGLTALTSFLGFLTQYYYIIYMAFVALLFCIYLVAAEKSAKQKVGKTLAYIAALLLTLAATYVVWPTWAYHLFGGYRGVEAAHNFSHPLAAMQKVGIFYGWLNDQGFGGLLWGLLAVMTAAALWLRLHKTRKKKDFNNQPLEAPAEKRPWDWSMILVAGAGVLYMLFIPILTTKTDWTNIRYFYPAYGPLQIAVAVMCGRLLVKLGLTRRKALAGLLALVVAMNVAGFANGQVWFLAEYHRAEVAYAYEKKEAKVICVHQGFGWFVSMLDELAAYEKTYFILGDELEGLPVEDFEGATEVMVYVVNVYEFEPVYEYLSQQLPWLDGWEEHPRGEPSFRQYRLFVKDAE